MLRRMEGGAELGERYRQLVHEKEEFRRQQRELELAWEDANSRGVPLPTPAPPAVALCKPHPRQQEDADLIARLEVGCGSIAHGSPPAAHRRAPQRKLRQQELVQGERRASEVGADAAAATAARCSLPAVQLALQQQAGMLAAAQAELVRGVAWALGPCRSSPHAPRCRRPRRGGRSHASR